MKKLVIMIVVTFMAYVCGAEHARDAHTKMKKFELDTLKEVSSLKDIKTILWVTERACTEPVGFNLYLPNKDVQEAFSSLLSNYITAQESVNLGEYIKAYHKAVNEKKTTLDNLILSSKNKYTLEQISTEIDAFNKAHCSMEQLKKRWQKKFPFFNDLYYRLYHQADIEIGNDFTLGLAVPGSQK